ncbi:MAG TPA: phosphatase PAP2 family protein, partial [Bacteroidia bacterium]|nr:phosphatase PAP2 family protein [Bacteroidia bacterium]
ISFYNKSKLGFLVLLIFSNVTFSQSSDTTGYVKHYHVNYFTGSLIIAGGLATDYPSIGRIKSKPSITGAELLALNISAINPIDRWALNQNPAQYSMYSKLSDEVEVPVYVLLPALLVLDKKIRKDWLDILFMYGEGHVITFTFYNYSWLGPTFQNRYRPITYYSQLPLGDLTTGNNRNSAYSGHTASVAFTSFFIAKVYADYNPNASKFLLYTAALIPPVIMGYLRVKALAHFPSDDMVGLTVGAVVGIVLPELHKFKCKGITLGVLAIPGASGLDMCWTLPTHKVAAEQLSITSIKPLN